MQTLVKVAILHGWSDPLEPTTMQDQNKAGRLEWNGPVQLGIVQKKPH